MDDSTQHDDQVTVVLPADLLADIDSRLGGEYTNRQQFMTAAARHFTDFLKKQGPADATADEPTTMTTQPDDALLDDRDRAQPNQPGTTVQPLPEDNDTPFSPPDSPVSTTEGDLDTRTQQGVIDPTHQALDSNIDPHEVYDEGLAGAAEAEEPNAGNAVTDYNPAADQRQQADDINDTSPNPAS